MSRAVMTTRLINGVVGAAALSLACEGTGPDLVSFRDPAALTAQLNAVHQSVASPTLASLGALARAAYTAGVTFGTVSPPLGTTYEWDATAAKFSATARIGAPVNAVRVILYTIAAATALPAVPLVENGYVDLFPHNLAPSPFPGDTASVRFVVTDAGAEIVADFLGHAETTFCRCATVEGWTNDGTTRVDFVVPYRFMFDGPLSPGSFQGTFGVASALQFNHSGSLPYGYAGAGFTMRFAFQDDTIVVSGGINLHGTEPAHLAVSVNAQEFFRRTITAQDTVEVGPGGRELTPAERAVVDLLYAVPRQFLRNIQLSAIYYFYH